MGQKLVSKVCRLVEKCPLEKGTDLRVEIDCYSLFDVESFLSYFVIQDLLTNQAIWNQNFLAKWLCVLRNNRNFQFLLVI